MYAQHENKDRVCYKCKREIKAGERYFRTGRQHQNRTNGINRIQKSKGVTVIGMGIRNICADCINLIYVDGNEV